MLKAKVNVSISAYQYEANRNRYLTATYPYQSITVENCIPPGQPMSSFDRLWKPFCWTVWLCISLSILLVVAAIYMARYLGNKLIIRLLFGRPTAQPFSNLWNSLYGGTIVPLHLPTYNCGRFLLCIWLLYGIVLRSVYISELYTMLQDGRMFSSLKTIDELISNDYVFFIYPVMKNAMLSFLNISSLRFTDADTDRNKNLDIIRPLNSGKHKIVLVSSDYSVRLYNRKIRNYNERLRVLPQKILTVPHTFFMPKNSYLTEYFDRILKSLITGGFVRKFEQLYLPLPRITSQAEEPPTIISLERIYGLFVIYGILLCFCLLVLILEIVSKYSRSLRRAMDFFNY